MTGQTLQLINGYTCPASALVFDPADNVWVGSADDVQVRLWDAATAIARRPYREHSLAIRKLVFGAADTSGPRVLLSGGFDQIVNVWDAQQGVLRRRLRGHNGRIDALAVSPSGQLFASAATDQTIRIWDSSSGRSLQLLQRRRTDHLFMGCDDRKTPSGIGRSQAFLSTCCV
jgi:WD40 repeat protein